MPRSGLTTQQQWSIAVLASICLGVLLLCWLWSGGLTGGQVDIDEAEPIRARFETDINTADWTELIQLPEIGESLAKQIVESREAEGPFKSLQNVGRVRGIGPATLEKIRPYLKPIP
jgi:competence protein ComEA